MGFCKHGKGSEEVDLYNLYMHYLGIHENSWESMDFFYCDHQGYLIYVGEVICRLAVGQMKFLKMLCVVYAWFSALTILGYPGMVFHGVATVEFGADHVEVLWNRLMNNYRTILGILLCHRIYINR